jgi:hypothetical protein
LLRTMKQTQKTSPSSSVRTSQAAQTMTKTDPPDGPAQSLELN